MRYTQIAIINNPTEAEAFLFHLDTTPAQDQHIIAGQYDYGDEDYGLGRYEDIKLHFGDEDERHGAYVVVRNVGLDYVVIYRDNEG